MEEKFHFRYTENSDLPRLAWCLSLRRGSSVATVTHGEWVETGDSGFYEGAWAGPSSENGFDQAFMTGTGTKICPRGLLLVTPTHTLDRLNLLRKREDETDVLYVSNSLAFLLAASGEALDLRFPFYDSYMSSIKFGVKNYEQKIATRSGARICLSYACNLLVRPDLSIESFPKKHSPSFACYEDYKAYLDATAKSIARNASELRREVRYSPLGTVSRGYDSPAAMVIAKAVGCDEAFTFRGSRGTLADEDCGSVIADHLNMAVREFDRLDYRGFADFPEILNSGGPNEFLSFGEDLSGRLLFTGFHGDKVWDKNCDKVTRDLVRGDASGASLTELRLKVGFYHLPVPFIGADSHPSIHAISNSSKMAKWSLGNFYDRPIARRIVEEAGVPRSLFGQRKRAAGVVVPEETLASTMSRASFIDFQKFSDEHINALASFMMHCIKVVKKLAYYNRGAGKLALLIRHRLKLSLIRVPFVIPHKLNMLSYGYLGTEAYLFHWGVDKLVSRYSAAHGTPAARSRKTAA